MFVTERLPIAAFLVATGRMKCRGVEVNKQGRVEFVMDGSEADGHAAELEYESGVAVPASILFNSYFGLKHQMYRALEGGRNGQ